MGAAALGVNREMRCGFHELTIKDPLAQSTPSQNPKPVPSINVVTSPVATSTCKMSALFPQFTTVATPF